MAIARPLPLAPIPVPKVWGGDRLRAFVGAEDGTGVPWPDGQPVGEVWLVCDRDERTSAVASGPFAGRTLRGLMLSEREALLGSMRASEDGAFPILVKLLEAQQNLSVQVHPDVAAAEALGSRPKSECWYVLDASEGAEVLLGLAPGVDATAFARGASSPEVVDLLQRFPVRTGDGIDVPAGTVHSIGAGIAIAEVQNNSDTTYRIYDWDRSGLDGRPRDIHVQEALRSIDYGRVAVPPRSLDADDDEHDGAPVNRHVTLGDGDLFLAEILDLHAPEELTSPGEPTVLVVLSGKGRLETGDGEAYALGKGSAWLLPADLESARVVEACGNLRVLRARTRVTA